MIWRHLGFGKDIFFITPLQPVEDDVKLFVGRDAEVREFLIDTLNGERSLKVVSGKIGVGKTSFVNACQYYSFNNQPPYKLDFTLPRILPCYEKIQLNEDDDLSSFIIKSIISLTSSIKSEAERQNVPLGQKLEEIVHYFQTLYIQAGGSLALGAQAFGFGGSIGGSNAKIPQKAFNVRGVIENIISFCREDLHVEGVFVLVNNLDILSKKKIISLLDAARDELFDISGIYWVIVGQEGLGSLIESETERLADYMSGNETRVKAVDQNTLFKIVEARSSALKLNDNAICPLEERIIHLVHTMSLKELRGTFRICGEIVKKVISKNPSTKIISQNTAVDAFMAYSHERAAKLELTENNRRILSAVFEKQRCRPKDYKLYGYESAPGFISALQSLVKKRLLAVEEIGKARIYKITGMTLLAGLTHALGDDIFKISQQIFEEALKGNRPLPQKDPSQNMQLELLPEE